MGRKTGALGVHTKARGKGKRKRGGLKTQFFENFLVGLILGANRYYKQ